MKTNFYRTFLIAATSISLLTAFSGQSDHSSTPSRSELLETASSTTRQGGDVDTDVSKSIRSVYTSLDFDDCEVLETYEESGDQDLRCKGYQDIPLYVKERNGHFDVDAGASNTEWTTTGRPSNLIGDTVEWRIHDGKPVAAILRYSFFFPMEMSSNSRSSELAVFTVGRKSSPGCLVNWVTADAQPSQNVAARQIADQQAEGFDCDSNQSTEPQATVQLPNSVIGTFDQTQADCSEPTMTRLSISQDKLQFYYGYATVDTVTFRDGGYDVKTTYFHLEGVVEVIPRTVEYRIKPNAQGDEIQFAANDIPKGTSPPLVRCDEL
jgi:hypothetical protein